MADDEGTAPKRRSFRDVPDTPTGEAAPVDSAPYAEVSFAEEDAAPGRGSNAETTLLSPVPAVWYRRPWVWIAAAAAVVVAGIGVTLALVLGDGDDGAAASPSPSALPTLDATNSPSPSDVPRTLLDDGIADDEYPAAAPARTGDYPEARVMEPWVWDKVGPGWAVVSIAPYDMGTDALRQTVIYLASPEGVLFEALALPASYQGFSVKSFVEADHKVRLVGWDSTTNGYGGVLADLDTGSLETMSFTIGGAPSAYESFIAATAANAEIWQVYASDYSTQRLERWIPATGWQHLDLGRDVAVWSATPSPDGGVIAVEIASNTTSGYASSRSGPDGEPVILIYGVDDGSTRLVRPRYDASSDYCSLAGVSDDGLVTLTCTTSDWTSTELYTATDGAALTRGSDGSALAGLYESGRGVDGATGLILTGTAGDATAHQVSIEGDGGEVVLLKSGDTMGFDGISTAAVHELGGGLAVITGRNACAVIDLENGHATLFAELGQGEYGCAPFGSGDSRAGYPGGYGGE